MEKEKIIYGALVIFSLGILLLITSNIALTGNIILNLDNYSKGDKFNGIVQVDFKTGEKINANSPILIMLSTNNSIVAVETLNFEEFANQFLKDAKKQDNYFVFNLDKTYLINAGNILNYSLASPGEYTFIFSILDKNLYIKRDFYVQETFISTNLLTI